MTGLTIYLNFSDLRNDGLPPERVSDTAPGQNVSVAGWLRRKTRVPAIGFRHGLESRNRPRPFKPAVIVCSGLKHLHPEFEGISLRCCGQFVYERLRGERRLGTVRVTKITRPQRRFPNQR